MPCKLIEGTDKNGHVFRAFQCRLYDDGLEPMERVAIAEMERLEAEYERDLQGRTELDHLALVDAYLDAVEHGYKGTMGKFDEDWIGPPRDE